MLWTKYQATKKLGRLVLSSFSAYASWKVLFLISYCINRKEPRWLMIFNSMLLPQRKQSCDKITILEKQGEIIGGMSEQGGLGTCFLFGCVPQSYPSWLPEAFSLFSFTKLSFPHTVALARQETVAKIPSF